MKIRENMDARGGDSVSKHLIIREDDCKIGYLRCQCGDSSDHVVVMVYCKDDGGEVFISAQLNPYLPWCKRLLAAIKYLFGSAGFRHHWTESIVSKDDLMGFIDELTVSD